MKNIFKNYTGNPFLNNALQTIEALDGLNQVSDITTKILLDIYNKYKIWDLFKRMKSYSMLFSRNGPLLNDKDFGDNIFKGIIEYTLENFENEGQYQCEISGLRFNTPFSMIYEKVLYNIEYPVTKIRGKDKTINRCWFPLTGALGSDAQALPQAKFEIMIHPICMVVIQFLPFSSLLYKGGILLIDSIDFDFTKDYIDDNVKRVLQRIEITPANKSVENIRDFAKGDYILKALKIYSDKKNNYDGNSDLNLWCFTNSGTGASCYIDRIPNQLFKTIFEFYIKSKTQKDLIRFLKSNLTDSFLDSLIEKRDFWGLYPRKVKNKATEGVGVPFYDAYQTAIGKDQQLLYAKYIAYLINEDQVKSKSDLKLLENFDSYKESEYNNMIYSILLRATQNGKWSLYNHLEILDQTNDKIIKDWNYGIHKAIQFYYHKKAFEKTCPIPKPTKLTPIISTIIHLIEKDKDKDKNIKRLQHTQDYQTFNINGAFNRNSSKIHLSNILEYTYKDYRPNRKGLNRLLHIFYSQPSHDYHYEDNFIKIFNDESNVEQNVYEKFVKVFQSYYLEKYNNDTAKYKQHILKSFPKKATNYRIWILDIINKMEQFYKHKPNFNKQQLKYFEENLFYSPDGEFNLTFSRFAVQFLLNQQFLIKLSTKEITTI